MLTPPRLGVPPATASAQSANGLYTGFLVRELTSKGARLEDAFKRTRLAVRLASRGQQVPWESTSLEEAVYLFPSGKEKLSDEQLRLSVDAELRRWNEVKLSPDLESLAAFIREYPSGVVSELAQSRLNRLLNEKFGEKPAVLAAAPPTLPAPESSGARPDAGSPAQASAKPPPAVGRSYGSLDRVFTEGDRAGFGANRYLGPYPAQNLVPHDCQGQHPKRNGANQGRHADGLYGQCFAVPRWQR